MASDRCPFDVVAVAVSAGGLAALTTVLSRLPGDFPVPIVVVQHLSRQHHSFLASILNRRVPLPVREAVHGAALQAGVVHIAPPDWHLRISAARTLALSQEERVHFTRPAADPLFASVAAVFGRRALGIVLTGGGEDGAAGTRAIKAAGGTIIVQHPDNCYQAAMPRAALKTGCVDLALSLPAIAAALVTFVTVRGAAALFGISLPSLTAAHEPPRSLSPGA